MEALLYLSHKLCNINGLYYHIELPLQGLDSRRHEDFQPRNLNLVICNAVLIRIKQTDLCSFTEYLYVISRYLYTHPRKLCM